MAKQLSKEHSDKLKKLIPMLASDKDGEVIATVSAIRRTLQADGVDLHDLAAKLSRQQRATTPIAIVPGVTINNKPATVESVNQLVNVFNQLQHENKELKAQNELLQANYNDLEAARKVTKSMKEIIVDKAFDHVGSIIVLLFVLWLVIK